MAEGPEDGRGIDWAETVRKLQDLWREAGADRGSGPAHFSDPANWAAALQAIARSLPAPDQDRKKRLWEDGLALTEAVLGQYGIGPRAGEAGPDGPQLPRSDPRFSDPAWRASPLFALVHQIYLMLGEELAAMAERIGDGDAVGIGQARFALRALIDALSPANFALTNPAAIEKARKTGGESLVRGMEHFLSDLRRGQLTHSDPRAFTIGENIAATPGKVVHQTRLFQLIQYMPLTERVLKVPLVIFPAWINRFYILDLEERKSFVRWALDQGISVFMVSWKSADASIADVTWDDYIAAQIEAVDIVRERLKAPTAHVIGYCVAGTTLAATLAVLARRGDAGRIASATLLTAQVDFSEPGDLGHFADPATIEAAGRLAQDGCLDGRYLAATFNLLRGRDLIWNYVERNYLLGEDYPAFDLLFWNGDSTNLPAGWLQDYLRDLYIGNRLVDPDALSACGQPIDLTRIATPCFVHAAREDHIAPPQSVWKATRHFSGPVTFLLAGSGHIAGVVNPPAAGRYGYWTHDRPAETFEDFLSGAEQHPGSWWPYWLQWLESVDRARVAARGKRRPGGRGDTVLEDAPGSYVRER